MLKTALLFEQPLARDSVAALQNFS